MKIEELLEQCKINKSIKKHFAEYQQLQKEACKYEGIVNPSYESLQLSINQLCGTAQSIGSYVYTIEDKALINCKEDAELLQDICLLASVIMTEISINKLNPKVHEHNAMTFKKMREPQGLPPDTMEIIE